MPSSVTPSGDLMSLRRSDAGWSTARLNSSIGGYMSVIEAERDARGRFCRRNPPSQSTARSAEPQGLFLVEWWLAL